VLKTAWLVFPCEHLLTPTSLITVRS